MGVKDLWKLLESAGRPVTLESLEGLVLAVGKIMQHTQTNIQWNLNLKWTFNLFFTYIHNKWAW